MKIRSIFIEAFQIEAQNFFFVDFIIIIEILRASYSITCICYVYYKG